jgi:hypothetical protein
MVTHEWGPVKCFINTGGTLHDQTTESGIGQLTGWWNGIAARDLDGDRDIDYVVTNFGLNTKYHASLERPTLLYYGDFENNGRMQLVEAEFEDNTLYPIRGKSCSTKAMPFLRDRFRTYRDFALADLSDLYSERCLSAAHRFEATTLESGVLLNDGNGKFQFRPLPRLAQASPAFGVVIDELNGDGRPDLYVVQNFFSPQPETGQMDGGLSLLMLGNGDGTFQPVSPQQSGLVVTGDAKSLTKTDLNGDGLTDLVVGRNNDRPLCFLRQPASSGSGSAANPIRVRLAGHPGNLSAVGARVTVWLRDGSTQTAEVCAGDGYLSQSSPTLTFGLGSSEVDRIEVTWPDGASSRSEGDIGRRDYRIQAPVESIGS